MKVPRSSNAMSYHFDCRKRAAGGAGDRWSPSNAGGSVNATPRYTSTNEESRDVVHPHGTAIDASNSFSDRFLNRSISDRHGCSRPRNVTRDSPYAELQAVARSRQTGIPPTMQRPVPLSVTENLIRTHASGSQDISYERLLSQDSQALQHESPIRKSDDGPFIVPEIPRKRQHLRTERGEAATITEAHREYSVGRVLGEGSLEVNDDVRQPLPRSSKFRKENTSEDTSRLLACPYLRRKVPGKVNHRCRAAAYPTIHRLKEHLYRVHQRPPHCSRCGETFPDPEGVELHLRRPEGTCDLVDFFVEGLTPEQVQKLKSRKRKHDVTTNEEKWQEIFEIVFPDLTDRPDPYYYQTDVGSIFSNIPSESEERFFTMLEPVFGTLEKSKRQKLLDTCKCFFAERMHQSSSNVLPSEIAAPELEGKNLGGLSLARTLPRDQDLTMLPATSTMRTVERRHPGAFQEVSQCSLFDLPNGTILDNIRPENNENMGTGNRLPPNECHNATGRSSTPSVEFDNSACDFIPFHDPNSLFNADGTSVGFDFDPLKDWGGRSPSGSASWATSCFHA